MANKEDKAPQYGPVRNGEVIGRTRNGCLVYGILGPYIRDTEGTDVDAQIAGAHFSTWTREDHMDAAKIHNDYIAGGKIHNDYIAGGNTKYGLTYAFHANSVESHRFLAKLRPLTREQLSRRSKKEAAAKRAKRELEANQ